MGVALITGAAKRLGAHIAAHLAAQGFDVVIHYHSSEDAAQALAKELAAKFHVQTAILQADLTNRQEMLELVTKAREAVGGQEISLLLNNASAFVFDRIDHAPDAEFAAWDMNMRTNLEAPYILTQSFAAQCQCDGVVINMIDQRVLRLTPNYGSYTLAKSALYTLTKTAAMALAPKIRVNAIGPGTTLQGAHQSAENFEYHRKISILERGADVEDILQAVDYLLNAKAVTGQMIAVDGGQHMIWQLPSE